jgi:hypothetical protein
MPVPWVRGFIWDDENLAHIARHGCRPMKWKRRS